MKTQAIAIDARRSPDWSDDLPERLNRAVKSYGFEDQVGFVPLRDLSSRTIFDGISVDSRSLTVAGNKWEAVCTVYVELQYDPNSSEPVIQNDAYPAIVRFHLEGDDVVIDDIEANVSSFYA